jgi:hypothetical protein
MKSFPPLSANKKLRDELKTDFLNDLLQLNCR